MAGNKNWTWQLRDRKGRWIDMGRGVKWYDSTRKKEVSGTVVGSDREGTAIVELTSEPAVNGKPQRATIQTNQVEAIKSKARIGAPATSPATVNRPDLNEDGLTDAEDDEVERLSGLIDRAEKAGQYDKTVRQEEQREALLQKGRKRLDGEEVPEDNQEPAQPKATTEPAKPEETATPSEADEDEFPEVSREVRESLKPEYGASVQHEGGPDFKGNYLSPEDAEKFPLGTQIWDGDTDESGLKSDKTWTKTGENEWTDQRGDLYSDDEQTYTGEAYEVYLPGNPENLTRPSDVAKASTESDSEPEEIPEPEAEEEDTPEPEVEPETEPEPEPEVEETPVAETPAPEETPEAPEQTAEDAPVKEVYNARGKVGDEIQAAIETQETDGTDPGIRMNGTKAEVTDIDKAIWTLEGPLGVLDDNLAGGELPWGQTKQQATSLQQGLRKIVNDLRSKRSADSPAETEKASVPEATEAPENAPEAPETATTPEQTSNAPETPSESVDEAFQRLGIERTEPVALEGEKFAPTRQQQDIIDAVLAGKDTSVQALAGTGKTSTVEALAKRLAIQDPDKNIAYIAFNKSVQLEAESRKLPNLEARTGHSIAHGWSDQWMKNRSNAKDSLRRADDVAGHLGIRQTVRDEDGEPLSAKDQALAALRTVDRYSNSAEDTIEAKHLPENIQGENAQKAVLDAANKVWEDLKDPEGKIRFTLDNMRKMWALSRPDLSKDGSGLKRAADLVVIDEAQDTPPVLARVIDEQKTQKLVVGDSNQNIYSSFTGSIDYMAQAKKDVELPLTKSWRFGPEVAEIGNRFLQLNEAPHRVEGGGSSAIVDDMQAPDAILVRSNGGMIGEILKELDNNRVVGVPTGTKQDLLSLVKSASYLITGNFPPQKMHDDLAAFKNWEEVLEEADSGNNAKVSMIAKLVAQHGPGGLRNIVDQVHEVGGKGLPGITFKERDIGIVAEGKGFQNKDALYQAGFRLMEDPEAGKYVRGKNVGKFRENWVATGTPEERQAKLQAATGETPVDVTISTAHKSKGLEWNRVKIGEDFRGPKVDDVTGEKTMPDPEEFRLGYVAVTRAQKELDPGSLSWVFDETDENGGTPTTGVAQTPTPETDDLAKEGDQPIPTQPDAGTDSGPATVEEAQEDAPAADDEPAPESIPAPSEDAPEAPVAETEEEDTTAPEEAPVEAPVAEEEPAPGEPATAPEAEAEPVPEQDTDTPDGGVADSSNWYEDFELNMMEPQARTRIRTMRDRIGDDEMGFTMDEERMVINDPEETLDTLNELITEVEADQRASSRRPPSVKQGQFRARRDFVSARDKLAAEMEKHSPYTPSENEEEEETTTPEPAPEETPAPEAAPAPEETPEPEAAPEPEPAPAEEEPEEAPAPEPEPEQAPAPRSAPTGANPIVGKATNYPDGTQITDMKTGQVAEKTNGEWHEAGDVSKVIDPSAMENLVTTEMPAQDKKSFEPFGGIDSLERGDIILTTGGAQASVVGKKDGKLVVYPHNVPSDQKSLRPSIVAVGTDKISGVNKFNGSGEESEPEAAPTESTPRGSSNSGGSSAPSSNTERRRAPNASGSNRGRTDLDLSDSRGNSVVIGDTVTSAKGDTGEVIAVRPSDGPHGSVKFRMADGSIKTVRGNKMTKRDPSGESETDSTGGPDVSQMRPGEGGMAPDGRMFLVSKNGRPVFKGDRVTLGDGSVHIVEGVYVSLGSLGFKDENGKAFRRKASTVEAEDNGPDGGGDDEGNSPEPEAPTPDAAPEPVSPTVAPDAFSVPEADRFPSEILDRTIKSFADMELDAHDALEQLPSKFAEPIGRFLNNDMTLAEAHELVVDLASSARYKAMAARTGGDDNGSFYATSRALRNLKYQLDADFPRPVPDLGGEKPVATYDGSEGMRNFDFASSPLNPLSPAAQNFTMPNAEKAARQHAARPATTAEGVTLRDGVKVWDRETGKYLGIVAGIGQNAQGTFATMVAVDAQQRRLQGAPARITRQFGTLETRDQSWNTTEDLDFSNAANGAEIDTKLAERYPGVEFNLKDGDDELSKQYGNTVSKLFNKYPSLATSMSGIGYSRFAPAAASWAAAQRSITLNANHIDSVVAVNNIHLQNFVTNARKNSNSGFYNNVPVGREMEYAVTHEIGHAIDYRAGNLTTERVHAIISEVWGKGDASKMDATEFRQNIKGLVSNYSLNDDGSINNKELVAESFADVEINGVDAKPISKAVHFALMSELKKLQEG